jgi:DNA-binding SARP family transcriptional activator
MVRLRAAMKLGAILAALAAVPAVLYAAAGNPLPAWPIDFGLVAESLATGAIATSTWLQGVAVGGWLVWGYVIVALTVDLLATMRNRPSPVRAAPVQWLASTIVALAVQLSTVNVALSPAATTVDVHVAAAPYEPADTADTHTVGGEVPAGTRLLVASEGDSWAGFAQAMLGDANVGHQIRTLNEGRDVGGRVLDGSEAFVEAGWQLVVPATGPAVTGLPAADEHGDGIGQPASDWPDEPAGVEMWEVEEGEHFWSIAETTLDRAHDTPPSEGQIASYWRELIDANADRLLPPHDPDLIYPGQKLVIPAVDNVDATTGPEAEDQAKDPGEGVDEAEGPDEHGERELADRAGPQRGATSDNGSGPTPPDDDTGRAEETGTSAVAGDQTDANDAGPDSRADADGDVAMETTSWGTPAGLATGTAATMLLGGGVLTLLRRRRRGALQQRPVHVRLPPLTDEQTAQSARLDAAAVPDEVLDELADLLCSIPEHAAPVLLSADDDGSVSLTFGHDNPLPDPPPAPWEDASSGDDEPVRWIATLGARGPRRSIGLPLLVTLGRHGTATVLGNVAAMKVLSVSGDDASGVDRQLRAFALEVATSRTAGPVEVTVAGGTVGTSIEQLRPTGDPQVEVAAAVDEVAQDIVADDRLPRLIICHDPATIPYLPGHVDLVGVIAADATSTVEARWWLRLESQHRVLHQPDGRHVVLDAPDFDPDLVTDELAALDTTVLMASDVDPVHEVAVRDDEVSEIRGWCEVALLGPVTVTLGGEPVDTLTSSLQQILAYLATHPAATTDQLEDAVWSGQAAGSSNRVRSALKRLRSELGTTPDGELLVPRRGSGEHSVLLSPQTTTDLDVAFGHLDAARHLDGDERLDRLLAALTLIRGTPFHDLPVSWATDLEHEATARLQDAALEAASALLEARRLDEAEHAVRQGLKLCDPCEPLYVVWAQIEHARGRADRIGQLWTRLRQRYADDADADDNFSLPVTPTADTQEVFATLTSQRDEAS